MTNNELARLVNECLNNRESQINFHSFSEYETDFNNYLNNDRDHVLRLKGILLKGMYLPIHGVWHANYDLHSLEDNEPLGNCLEIPLEIIDQFRNPKDPESLDLFVYHLGDQKFDVYIMQDKTKTEEFLN